MRARQTSSSGGSSESELTALAVVPVGRPAASRVVTSVTPVANRPIPCRRASPIAMSLFSINSQEYTHT